MRSPSALTRSSSVFCFFRLLTLISSSLSPSLVSASSGSRFLFLRLSLDDCAFLDAFLRRSPSSLSELVVVPPPLACLFPPTFFFFRIPSESEAEESWDPSPPTSFSVHIEEPKAGSYCHETLIGSLKESWGGRRTRSMSPSSTRTFSNISTCSSLNLVSVILLLLRKERISLAFGKAIPADAGYKGCDEDRRPSSCLCFGSVYIRNDQPDENMIDDEIPVL